MIQKLNEPLPRRWTKAEYYRLGELGFFNHQKVELLDGEIWLQFPEPGESGLPYPSREPHPRLWTKAEYYRLGELGFFEGQKAELLEGEIVVTSPQNWPHASTVDRVDEVLRNALGSGFWVRSQLPMNLGQILDPEPDVSVVPGKREDYSDHPTAGALIVEVSDPTLEGDRGNKASLYARAGVADYWIVNLVDQQLEVYRNPQPEPSHIHGYAYADQMILHRGDSVSTLAAPQLAIPVTDLLG